LGHVVERATELAATPCRPGPAPPGAVNRPGFRDCSGYWATVSRFLAQAEEYEAASTIPRLLVLVTQRSTT